MDLVNVTSGSASGSSFDTGKARNIFKDISFRTLLLVSFKYTSLDILDCWIADAHIGQGNKVV